MSTSNPSNGPHPSIFFNLNEGILKEALHDSSLAFLLAGEAFLESSEDVGKPLALRVRLQEKGLALIAKSLESNPIK